MDKEKAALKLEQVLADSVHAVTLRAKGWKFRLSRGQRGWCYYGKKLITIPDWVFTMPKEYAVWYAHHEMAHAFCKLMGHGPEFMAKLKEICPEDVIHFELGYKPRNAKVAGIKPKQD